MSDEQSIRDEARAYIYKKHPGWHDNGVGIYRSGFADGAEWALTDSPVIRRIQAEALRSARADIQAYIDSGSPFGHRPVEQFLDNRADRIERGETA